MPRGQERDTGRLTYKPQKKFESEWLGHKDSNLGSWHQKPESCRWTMAQCPVEWC